MGLGLGSQLPSHTKSAFRRKRRGLKKERVRKIRRLGRKDPENVVRNGRYGGYAD